MSYVLEQESYLVSYKLLRQWKNIDNLSRPAVEAGEKLGFLPEHEREMDLLHHL